ncbi:HPt (histidine-containing phosphotransfer) domain-containing protein [Mesoflavibacter sabulilitoris]|uniref:Histidine kinase n=1 Tax=Mesoflavibacter zeaxanthinifaciens subsp. sabulilitoris TaxID=1520893 RepID=A0A2T1N7F2_9FLAO|nr:histidine kinase [Mesoflavibacter zeaxanthinifaciens]MBB3124039.1 HPt (histidine-containing phosphotransfer) domain-containing protein [Mesoflavibacter zeaxanthinifaciens subsp. sabulilitoris]PSG87786.1 histidine kinase [Mesoflavibacter zeaxanthinifaciens subsp. sabulilitoris]
MEQPNLSYINTLSGGDKEFETQLLDVVKKEFPTEKETYYKNLNNKNYKLAAENVHKLKHKISILGLSKSYDIAIDYENNLLDHNTDLKEEFDNILTVITNYLDKL